MNWILESLSAAARGGARTALASDPTTMAASGEVGQAGCLLLHEERGRYVRSLHRLSTHVDTQNRERDIGSQGQ